MLELYHVYLHNQLLHSTTDMQALYHVYLHEVRHATTDEKRQLHSKKRTTCSGLMKTALNNVVLPTLFNVVNNIVQHC